LTQSPVRARKGGESRWAEGKLFKGGKNGELQLKKKASREKGGLTREKSVPRGAASLGYRTKEGGHWTKGKVSRHGKKKKTSPTKGAPCP